MSISKAFMVGFLIQRFSLNFNQTQQAFICIPITASVFHIFSQGVSHASVLITTSLHFAQYITGCFTGYFTAFVSLIAAL